VGDVAAIVGVGHALIHPFSPRPRLGTVCLGQGLWPGTIYRFMGKGEVAMMHDDAAQDSSLFFRYGRLEKQKLGLRVETS